MLNFKMNLKKKAKREKDRDKLKVKIIQRKCEMVDFRVLMTIVCVERKLSEAVSMKRKMKAHQRKNCLYFFRF